MDRKTAKEKWRLVKPYSCFYVSTLGRFKRVSLAGQEHFLTPYYNKKRHYCYIALQENGQNRKNYLAHRLVAKAFISNPKAKPHVNHIDFNTAHNSVGNLEWVTRSENIRHSIRAGHQTKVHGEKMGGAVLKNKTVLAIVKDRGSLGLTYLELAHKYNTNYSNIAHIMSGRRWGFITKIEYKRKTKGLDML